MQDNKSQNATDVIARLKSLLKLKTDIELSEFLNIRPNTISTWKKRNSVDHDAIISICELYELDLNEIFLAKSGRTDFAGDTPLLSREVQFQYASGADREGLFGYVPKYKFPFVSARSIAFQVTGNNMFPLIDENSFVICEPETNVADVTDNTTVVIVTKTKGIFLNRIHKSGANAAQYILANENDFYGDITLDVLEIAEIWKVIGVISYDISREGRFKFISDSLKTINKFLKKNEIKH
jgi:hypothetical protein